MHTRRSQQDFDTILNHANDPDLVFLRIGKTRQHIGIATVIDVDFIDPPGISAWVGCAVQHVAVQLGHEIRRADPGSRRVSLRQVDALFRL